MDLEQIKRHWEKAGKEFPAEGKVTPTTKDFYLGMLERENFLGYLRRQFKCLEIGCGDGLHTLHYARKVKQMFALDISRNLIKIAEKRLQKEGIDNTNLYVGSVLEVEKIFEGHRFDCVISQRCLINLPNWEYQKRAINLVCNLLSEEGIFLLTEGFQDNLNNLNQVRRLLSLAEIQVVGYNRNLVLGEFSPFICEDFEVLERHHYGPYLFLSRVFHPLAVFPDSPVHDSKLNEVGFRISRVLTIPDLEKYSYNLFYALRKKKGKELNSLNR